MKRSCRQYLQRRGATAVEFGLCVPVLFAVLFGIIEFSRMLQVQHSVRQAAMEGARAGLALDAVTSDATTAAANILSALGIVNATTTINPNPISYTSQTISVTVSAPVAGNGWLLWFFTGGQPIVATITLAREIQAVSVTGS